MLRTHGGKKLFEEQNPNCDYSRSNQMPSTGEITEIAPCTCAPIYDERILVS